jgi:hypothetical protein
VPRQQDEALWTEFRRHCDTVFARSSQERAAHESAATQQHARALELCAEAERLPGQEHPDVSALARRLAELRNEFETLELPRPGARDIRRRFAHALERAEESVRRGRARVARDGWIRAVEASARVRACALAAARDVAADEREALRSSAESAIALLQEPWLRAGRDVLASRLSVATAGPVATATDVDLSANEEALRTLCVRGELLAGLETPAEDVDRRREHQMRRLVQSMGQGVQADPGDLAALVLEWLGVGPVEPTTEERLRARFERCVEVLA